MNIKVTGDARDIANAAWISTTDEIKTKNKTHEDVERVVKFLIENHHTSPLEAVTITLKDEDRDLFSKFWAMIDGRSSKDMEPYKKSPYAKVTSNDDAVFVTLDLLNFLKITFINNLFDKEPWKLFEKHRPLLSKLCLNFKLQVPMTQPIVDLDQVLGEHDMKVELISLHTVLVNNGPKLDFKSSRATWRVKVPLSIATQILRHRTGSFNQVSGRYKTIRQEMVSDFKDCSEIFSKIDLDLVKYFSSVEGNIALYESVMSKASKAKGSSVITNEEYKRLREVARYILPEGRMTELYITFYLNDFYNNFIPLRESIHAQTEHAWVAREMHTVLQEHISKLF